MICSLGASIFCRSEILRQADTDQSDKLVEEVEMMLAGVCVCVLFVWCVFVSVCGFPAKKTQKNT